MRISLELLTPEAFAPFGQVLESPAGETGRVEWAAKLESTRPAARANLSVVRYAPTRLPLEVSLLERHPFSTQTFIPMDCSRYLVLVCEGDGGEAPDPATLRAFLAGADQGISYRRGVWHHGMTPLDRPAVFGNLIWQEKTADDCHFHRLSSALAICG